MGAAEKLISFVNIIKNARMVFEHSFFAQDLPERLRGLLDDGGVRDDIDHAPVSVCFGVRQCKRERGNGFSAAGRHGQRKKARRTVAALLHATVEDGTAAGVQIAFGREPAFHECLQPLPKCRNGLTCFGRRVRISRHKCLRIPVIRID